MPERAGVEPNSVLKAIDGQDVFTVEEVLAYQEEKGTVEYTVFAGEEFEEEQVIQVGIEEGKTGIALSEFALAVEGVERSFGEGSRLALRETWMVTKGTVEGIGMLMQSLLFKQRVPKGIAGIVGIAQLTHSSLQEGIMVYLRLVALLSLSLAILNVLPFPALDGGRIMFVLFEMLSGRPVNRRIEVITNGVGILFIMVLMVAVTWNDIARLLSETS